jgi:hypothetical protein
MTCFFPFNDWNPSAILSETERIEGEHYRQFPLPHFPTANRAATG